MQTPTSLLAAWIGRQAPATAQEWLTTQQQKIASGDFKTLALSMGLVPRKLGKADLDLTADDLAEAHAARPGWKPAHWSIDQAARTLLLLAWPACDEASYRETLDKLFSAGDIGELVALYQALPLLPFPDAHRLRAAEGIRTNMKSVFCAVAHNNPYPAEKFDDDQFNQMILKCLFVDVALDPIVGLDRRVNEPLMRMLVDYAHERWAAGRTFNPELWRPVGPVASEEAIQDLVRVLESGDERSRHAAALALSQSDRPEARAALASCPELAQAIARDEVNWQGVSPGIG
jgi:hypothetical protein